MGRNRRETADETLSETLSRLPAGIRTWTHEQVIAWVRTGAYPPHKLAVIPKALRIAVWHRDHGICRICEEPADPLDWTCDHILPQSLDGPTIIDNLRVTHPRCNRSRTHPYRMTQEELDEATDEWTANEIERTAPNQDEWIAVHLNAPAITREGEWTCQCQMCVDWRAATGWEPS